MNLKLNQTLDLVKRNVVCDICGKVGCSLTTKYVSYWMALLIAPKNYDLLRAILLQIKHDVEYHLSFTKKEGENHEKSSD